MIDIPKLTELATLSPVLILIVVIGSLLLSAVLVEQKLWKHFLLPVAALGLGAVAVLGCWLIAASGVFRNPDIPKVVLAGSVIFDPLFVFMTVFLCVFLLGVLMVSSSLWEKPSWEWPVFLCALVGSLIGMVLLASTRHLIFFAIAFELASMPSYVLVGFRRFNAKSAEGSAKYVIFGAACSALMMYGISLLYGLTGSFDIQGISGILATRGVQVTQVVALVCLLAGFAFKISLVPMHFWCPDAFEAAGADIAAWLSVASKSAALIALARFVQFLTAPRLAGDQFNHSVVLALTVVAVVTMTVANLSAYWQKSVKRLLAYSSIAHAGYIVCGVMVLSGTTGMAAIVAYVVVYMLMNLGAFAVVGLVERQTGSDDLRSFSGLGNRNPFLAVVMVIFLFSLVGLPPLAGFAVKWILLSVLWQQGLIIPVVAILANTLFSLFYYMRVARAMYFETSDLPAVPSPVAVSVVLTVCAAGLLILFFGWGALNNQLLAGIFG